MTLGTTAATFCVMDKAASLKVKFRTWLEMMLADNPSYTARQLAHALGLPPETVYRVAPKRRGREPAKQRRPGRFDADALDRMSSATGLPAWSILQHIETSRSFYRPPPPPRAPRKKVLPSVSVHA